MTDQPYTQADLRAEAMLQLRQLAAHHSPLCVGSQMEGEFIRTEDPDTGEFRPAPGSDRWGDLPEGEFDLARDAIHGLVAAAADLSEWAVRAGIDSLQPDPDAIDDDPCDPTVRVHIAFDPDVSEEAREIFRTQLRRFMRT